MINIMIEKIKRLWFIVSGKSHIERCVNAVMCVFSPIIKQRDALVLENDGLSSHLAWCNKQMLRDSKRIIKLKKQVALLKRGSEA